MRSKYMRAGIKHFFKKFIGKKDEKWLFYNLENNMRQETWEKHDAILSWAENMAAEQKENEQSSQYESSTDPVVKQGYQLREKVMEEFYLKCKGKTKCKFLIHVPPANESTAGFSIFNNMVETFKFLGIEAEALYFTDNLEEKLCRFSPTVFLTSDSADYLLNIDWDKIRQYRDTHELYLSLSANVGKRSIDERLAWANDHKVDFYYTYDDLRYCKEDYQIFFENGFDVVSIHFGANILKYYPVPDVDKNIDYAFLASSNRDKWNRYVEYFPQICKNYTGFISGPGWSKIENNSINADRDRYVYARTKCGINLHLDFQIDAVNQLNERTYMLAACGVPQLIDHPAILLKYFSEDGFFIANDAKEYGELFEYILHNPEEAQRRALNAQREVFSKYTCFHRAEKFIFDLKKKFGGV